MAVISNDSILIILMLMARLDLAITGRDKSTSSVIPATDISFFLIFFSLKVSITVVQWQNHCFLCSGLGSNPGQVRNF